MHIFPFGTGLGLWVFFLSLFPLVLLVIPWVFFLLNLRALLWQVAPQNRAMSADLVWLTFIPVFGLGWFIYTVTKVRDSVRAEYDSRGWSSADDFGYNVGVAAGVLGICLLFFSWIPFIGWALGVSWLVCWILYWLKTSDLKHQLELRPPWSGPGVPPPYLQPPGDQAPAGDQGPAGGPPPASPDGSRGPRVKQCAVCGTPITPDDKFCRTCGLKLPQRPAEG